MRPTPEIVKKWNIILHSEGLDVIRPQKPNKQERKFQSKSKKVGVPGWASAGKSK